MPPALGREFLAQIEARELAVSEYPVTRLYGPHALAQQLRFARHLRRRRIQIMHSYTSIERLRDPGRADGARAGRAGLHSRHGRSPHAAAARRLTLWCRLADHVTVNAEAVRDS
jgi:hypothetical protein